MKRTSAVARSGDHKRLRNESENNLPEVADFEYDLTQTQNRRATLAPASTGAGEFSMVQTMTADEINEHVLRCLEMSSENKITHKNAFALQLIDCLKYLADKKKDFSTMACSLDAGAKIYSYRVDALHQQVISLAEEVMMNARKKQNAGEEDTEGPDTPRGRLVRKKKGIVTKHANIVRKLKRGDPKDKYLKVTALPGAVISGVRLDQKYLSFTLENDIPYWPDYTNYKPTRAEGTGTLPKIEVVRDNLPLARFDGETNNFSPEHILQDQDSNERDAENQPEENPCSPIDRNVENHYTGNPNSPIDRDVENQPEETPFSPASDTNDHVEDVLDDINDQDENGSKKDDDIEVVATAMRRLNEEAEGGMCPPPTRVEAIKMLFDMDSEYHYLDMKHVKYWAGPDYWKRPQGSPASAENQKKTRGRRKKEPGLIDFDWEDAEEKWGTRLKSGPLSAKTVMNWKPSRLTIPKDLKYDIETFINLFHMKFNKDEMEQNQNEIPESGPEYRSVEFVDVENRISSVQENEHDDDPFNSAHHRDDDVYDENSGNARDEVDIGDDSCDSRYQNSVDSRDEVDNGDNSCDSRYQNRQANSGTGRLIKINVDSDNTPGYDDASLVPAPKMVKVNPIRFKSRPIRVNMRHLKEVMLEQIKNDFKSDERRQQTTFSKLLTEIPPRLERTTAKDLSPSMAFLALLTLANENNLRVNSCNNYKDAIVTLMDDENDNRIEDSNQVEHVMDMANQLSEPVHKEVVHDGSSDCSTLE